MRHMIKPIGLLAALLVGCANPNGPARVAAVTSAPAQPTTIRYGDAPSQRVELFLPAGRGPHPVVAFIHGGCYRASVAGAEEMRPVYAALAARGIAVWGVGYRRVDEAGGPYPGMYADVAAALDLLPREAARRGLDASRVVVAGHSAGGHLALWAAGRPRLPRSSALWSAAPLRPSAVIAVAAPGELAPIVEALDRTCGPGTRDGVVGRTSATRADLFADTSPGALVPLGLPTTLIVGERDTVVTPAFVAAYAARATAAGDTVDSRVLPGADHMQVVTPGDPAFDVVADAISRALGRP